MVAHVNDNLICIRGLVFNPITLYLLKSNYLSFFQNYIKGSKIMTNGVFNELKALIVFFVKK